MGDARECTIVIAEDDDAMRTLLQRQLERAGYCVQPCPDGREALACITTLGSALVLADWQMPGMDGIELCRALRELENMQALGDIYFLILTAYTDKDRIIEGLGAGANDYLTKPYHPGELLARIRVGERILLLQRELQTKTREFQKANLELALIGRKLDEMANSDALTSLSNRRCFLARLHETWHSTARTGHTISCIMLDVDRFKSVNDTHGHEAGDAVLREVASRVRQVVTRPELVGRLGGEEFAIVCPAQSRQQAAEVAERVRLAIAATPVKYAKSQIPVTTSCGVAERSAAAGDPTAMIRLADYMLYAAKQHGRNQTWVAGDSGEGRAVLAAVLAAELVAP